MTYVRSVTNSELVSCTMPPMVGGGDSTVVGFLRRSPVIGERVGERVQGGFISEEQGTPYSCTCLSQYTTICHIEPPMYNDKPLPIPPNNGIHLNAF